MAQITFNETPITNIIDEITVKADRDYNTSPYIGGTGSNSSFISELGRVISFKSLCPSYEEVDADNPPIQVYRQLSEDYRSKTAVLTSESHLDLKGNYLVTGFEVTEDTGHNFTIDWEFTEVVPFNSIRQTFQVFGSANKNSKKQQTTSKTSGGKLNKSSKKLLKSCGVLSSSTKVKPCVKYLQKFMQSLGYYKKYKVDGVFGKSTKSELKKLQKAKKLKKTGEWDKKTIKYFQKKYKYP